MKYSSFIRGATIVSVLVAASVSFGQPGQLQVAAVSSDWEATGFNNGRRIVRDSNGYFHAVWHTSSTLPSAPSGTADVYYAYTTSPAAEPPSMAAQGMWAVPTNMTTLLGNTDNRYPLIAIEYAGYDSGQWQNFNTIHVVWQALQEAGGARYEVLHATIPVSNPPAAPAAWNTSNNLSVTPTDSLVPSIAINRNSGPANQHIHVVWQEEDTNDNLGVLPPPAEDAWYSDIAYSRSTDSGVTWGGPAGGWGGYTWYNLTLSSVNSQMPSVSCVLDQFTTSPAQNGIGDMEYTTTTVHVAYNEDFGGGLHVYYLFSASDGLFWNPAIHVTAGSGGLTSNSDAYPNVAVDMLDGAHIVFMRDNIFQSEPVRTGAPQYVPGLDPTIQQSFPGPSIGMYGVSPNAVVYARFTTGTLPVYWTTWEGPFFNLDQEFPTVALDRWQHVSVNWQECPTTPFTDYEIKRDFRLNATPPSFPLIPQVYGLWQAQIGGTINDSNDATNDDLFPNLAHKKVAQYMTAVEPVTAGYDEVWTKVTGNGAPAAIAPAPPKQIWQDGNMGNDPAVPVTISRFAIE